MNFKRDMYHNQRMDKNDMGQVHFERNVYQNQCPNIRDYDIIYGNTHMCAYCDVDWVGNMDDHKSASSYVFLLGNGVISWNNKKQTSIAMSSTKVQYMATLEAMWFSSFFGNIGVPQMKPIVIYDDNQSCIYLSKNLIFHVHAKNIEIHHHLVQAKIEKDFVKLVYCNTKNMVTYILTKRLYIDKHEYF